MKPFELPVITPAPVRGSASVEALALRRPRLPPWFKTSLPTGAARVRFEATRQAVDGHILHTVCEEAQCPNIHDCWGRGSATFMIAGKSCTRGCRFCAVDTVKVPDPLDGGEPERLADAVAAMNLSYVVITVVNRDDLADGGAGHYRACIEAVVKRCAGIGVELLCSDLSGNETALKALLKDLPLDVFAHNVECVPRLDRIVRDPRASFEQSLRILARAKVLRPDLVTKSSIMLGVGETDEEIVDALIQLRRADVDLVTLGQYLAPSDRHLPVARFVTPETFADLAHRAGALGFRGVASGPLVRSSYRADLLLENARTTKKPLVFAPVCSSGGDTSHSYLDRRDRHRPLDAAGVPPTPTSFAEGVVA